MKTAESGWSEVGLFDRLLGRKAGANPVRQEPRAEYQPAGGGVIIRSPEDLEAALREGAISLSGTSVTPNSAMKVAAVYGCVRIRSSIPANMPLELMRRDGARRSAAVEHAVYQVLKRRPNRWQTPSQFKRMLTAHVQLRGNGYAHKVVSRNRLQELIPLHPDRVTCEQRDDLALRYVYTRRNGTQITFDQAEIFHLVGLSLDGVQGVSPITYARETIGSSLAMEQHGANVFRNGAQFGTVFKMPDGKNLSTAAYERLKASLDSYRQGGEDAGGTLLLEEGLDVGNMTMSAADAQFIENKRLTRADIAMFFGVPPHMIGDTEKQTNVGKALESQTQSFVSFTAEDDLTMWEETIGRDLLAGEQDLYARFNRNSLVRSDLQTRTDHYVKMLQWGVYSPDKVLELEDENPREDGHGNRYYEPPNTAGSSAGQDKKDETDESSSAP